KRSQKSSEDTRFAIARCFFDKSGLTFLLPSLSQPLRQKASRKMTIVDRCETFSLSKNVSTDSASTHHDLFGRYPGARARGAVWVAKALLLSFATLLILLVVPKPIPAQTPGTGAIVGTITDPSGARVSDAHVRVINNATDFSRESSTTADGIFRCTLLPPGNYSLTIEAAGFETLSSPGISVLSSSTTSIDFRLQIGTSTTTV